MRRQLPLEVLKALGHAKLVALRAPATAGVGERRSRAVGAGMEFAEYKDYEPGDDLRHVDRHVMARHGRAVVRRFHLEQRLSVQVLLDASASMAVDPRTWQRAVDVAALFGTASLNGGDQVRFGVAQDGRVAWGGVASRDPHLRHELTRLERVTPRGGFATMADMARASLEALAAPGLLVVVSDWLMEGHAEALRTWSARSQEVVAVQLLGAGETGEPVETGRSRLVDAETGAVMELDLDASAWRAYRTAVAEWSAEVRSAVWAVEGRWVSVPVGGSLSGAFVSDLRRLGIVA